MLHKLLFAAILTLLLLGCTQPAVSKLSTCKKMNGEWKDRCINHFALVSRDSLICSEIVDASSKDMCLMLVALSDKDASKCDKILGKERKAQCFSNMGILKAGYEVCNTAGALPEVESCRLAFLPSLKDPSICTKMATPEIRDICLAQAADLLEDANLCKLTQDLALTDSCIASVAIYTQNASLCEGIKAKERKDDCSSQIYKND
jgi:hypothetical protein